MYFDWRLFTMTRGVRGRIALAAVLGLAGVPVALWRLTLQGQAMARIFTGDAFDAIVGMLVLIAALVAMGADFLDSIQGLATLKAFGQSTRRGDELAERARHLYRSTMWVLAVNIATGGITLLGISAGAALALGWGAVRVQAGELPLSTLLVVLLLGVEVFRPLRDLVQLFHGSMLAVAATRGMYQLLDAVPEVREPVEAT